MGKAIIYIYDEMADFEMTLATHFLGGYMQKELVPVSTSKEIIRSKPGILYSPLMTVKEALMLEDAEVLLIPGGWKREQTPELTELIKKMEKENKLICAICAAPEFLCRAGILKNYKYTTTLTPDYFQEIKAEDIFPRQNYVEAKVVRDRNLITAKGTSFVDFAVEIADYFNLFANEDEKKEAAGVYKGMI